VARRLLAAARARRPRRAAGSCRRARRGGAGTCLALEPATAAPHPQARDRGPHASLRVPGRPWARRLRPARRRDDRLDTLAESLVETQWPDGGWNCDLRPEASHSSFNETWGPILGLAEYGAIDAAKRGAEFLLEHRVYKSHRTGEPAHPAFLKLRYPPYWHYDVLVGLTVLDRSVRLADPRTADALELLESKRGPDGSWRAEGRWWKRPGAKGSNVEAVDWGETADELLTERAQHVLSAA